MPAVLIPNYGTLTYNTTGLQDSCIIAPNRKIELSIHASNDALYDLQIIIDPNINLLNIGSGIWTITSTNNNGNNIDGVVFDISAFRLNVTSLGTSGSILVEWRKIV